MPSSLTPYQPSCAPHLLGHPLQPLRVRAVTFNMNFKIPTTVPEVLLGRAGCPQGLTKYDIVVVGTQESGPIQVSACPETCEAYGQDDSIACLAWTLQVAASPMKWQQYLRKTLLLQKPMHARLQGIFPSMSLEVPTSASA